MRFKKKYKRGLLLLFILLLLTGSISFITINPKSNKFDGNSVFLSALEDNYEQNDDPASATDIRFNEEKWLSFINGTGTLWDDDWYMIDLDFGEERLKAELIFNHSAGNIDIEVFNSTYSYIAGNYSMDDNEILELDIFPDGIYYLRVFGDNAGNTYDLWWEDLMPIDDQFEENDDFWSSKWVSPNYYSNLKIVDGDEDWFRTYLNSGETLDLRIYFNHLDGDLQFELYDPSYTYRTGDYSSDDNEFIYFTADMSGDWRFKVYHEYANSIVSYDLDIWLNPAADDWMEENDDFGSATYVNPNYYPGLTVLHGDEDWFRIYLNPGNTINISIYFNDLDGNLELELYDPFNSYRIGSHTTDNYEYIFYTTDMSGDWRIRVYHADANSNVFYDLDILLYGGDDWMEENDDFWSAWYVDPNYYSGLKIVHGDEDWFRTYLNVDDILNVSIYFDHNQGNLTLELYDPFNSYQTGSYSIDNDEFIRFTVNMSGEWAIRVYHADANSEVFYDMDIWVYRGDDWMEENDDYWGARWVDPQYYPDLMIIEGDDDWFRTYLNVDDTIDIRINFDSFEGNLQLELYGPNDPNNLRDGSYSNNDGEFISYTADISGDWRFRIYHEFRDSNVRYHLEVRINGEIGGDDPYEPNNNFDEAYDLHDDEHVWLSNLYGLAVQGDEDWYRIDVTPGFQHLIVKIKFNQSLGNINVDIYKRVGMGGIDFVTSNYSLTGKGCNDINITHIDPGIYFIQIHGDSSGVEYNLWWDDKRTDNRPDDNYEDNDNSLTAYDLTQNQYENLWWINGTAIQRDNDWYRIHVETGFEHLFVIVMYDYQEGAIGIEIIDLYGSQVTYNITEEDNEIISFDLPSNGTYYIRIFGDHSGNIYSIRWETWEPHIEEMIPGYDIFILLGAIFGVVVLFTLKWKRSRKHL